MAQKIPTWVWVAGLAGVGYALYKLSDAFKQGINYVTAPVTDAIANTIASATMDTAAQTLLTGAVLFPNGAQVPIQNLTVTPSGTGNAFRALVTYQGKTYQLAPHDANGNYPASPV